MVGCCLCLYFGFASLLNISICARVIVSVPFHEVHNAPNTKARADGNNESLQNGNSLIEEFHSRFSPDCSIDKNTIPKEKQAGTSSVLPAPAILASPFIFIKISLLESQKCRDQSDKSPATGSARTGGRVYLLRIMASFLCRAFFGHIHLVAIKFFIHPQP